MGSVVCSVKLQHKNSPNGVRRLWREYKAQKFTHNLFHKCRIILPGKISDVKKNFSPFISLCRIGVHRYRLVDKPLARGYDEKCFMRLLSRL